MKQRAYLLRIAILVIIGLIATFFTYQSRYSVNALDQSIFRIMAVSGSIFWIWTLVKDLRYYRHSRQHRYLLTLAVAAVFFSMILLLK